MAKLLGLLLAIAGIVAFSLHYETQSAAYGSGFRYAPTHFEFWLTAALVGFMAAHVGGDRRWMAPLVFIAVGALFALLAARSTNIPEIRQLVAPSIFVLGLLVAYSAKPENWLAYGAAALGGATQGFMSGGALGGAVQMAGFAAGLAAFLIGGIVFADICGRIGGGSMRARFGAGAAGIGLYLTLEPMVSWV